MAKLSLATPPTPRIVSPGDLHTHCRIDDTTEDAYLEQLSDAAQEEAEGYTWRKFLQQTWDQYFDGFADPLHLRYPPLHSDGVTGVTYTDSNGDTQTLATSVYEVAEEDGITIVRRKYNQTWPTTRAHEDVVKVTFVCGWDSASDVPERIKHAIRLHAAHFYRNREGEPVPDAFYRLLDPYRVNKYQPIGAAS
jgi:uncharacterized phiE125 gp8 family phage protein